MNGNRLISFSKRRIIRNYLWHHDKKNWLFLILEGFLARTKRITAFSLFIAGIFIYSTLIPDGTAEKEFLKKKVRYLMETLPRMEESFKEIDQLASSISNATYKDPDLSFVYAFLITKWAWHNSLDPLEVAAVAMTESGFNHKAVSNKDARGLMQVHKPSWSMSDYFDTEENVRKGAMILLMYKRQGEDYLAKYSGGATDYAAKVERNKLILKKSFGG